MKRITYVFMTLLLLTGISAGFLSGTISRYLEEKKGEDLARTAVFSIQTEGTYQTSLPIPELKPGDSEIYTILLKNQSEVAAAYTIEASNVYKNLPVRIELLKEKTGSTAADVLSGVLKAQEGSGHGTETEAYIRIQYPDEELTERYSGKVDLLRVTVTSEQAD